MAKEKGRSTFICNKDWYETLRKLPVEDRVCVYDAIFEYAINGEVPEMDFVQEIAFTPIKVEMERDMKEYENIHENRRQAAIRREERKKQSGAPTTQETTKSTVVHLLHSCAPSAQLCTREKEKKDEKENSPHTPYKEKEEKEKKVEMEEKDTLKCVRKEKTPMQRFVPPTVEEVVAYVKAKGYDVDAEAFVAFYESKGWKVGYQPMKSWKAATVTWMKKQRADGKVDRLEERKRTLVQDESLLGRVNKWFIANAPYIVGHFETLLTVEQYNFLLKKYGKDRLTDTIMDLENRHDMCDKYNNLNTTLINWLENGKQ